MAGRVLIVLTHSMLRFYCISYLRASEHFELIVVVETILLASCKRSGCEQIITKKEVASYVIDVGKQPFSFWKVMYQQRNCHENRTVLP